MHAFKIGDRVYDKSIDAFGKVWEFGPVGNDYLIKYDGSDKLRRIVEGDLTDAELDFTTIWL